jgi:glycosyltransferase involved in cell wall biosynthesis
VKLALKELSDKAHLYKWQYWLSQTRFRLASRFSKPAQEYDLVFVFFRQKEGRGWILEAICKEIVAFFPGKYCIHYSPTDLPPAKAYFMIHYVLVPEVLKFNPVVWGAKRLLWYTHPRDTQYSEAELVYAMNSLTKVVCSCSEFVRLLESKGVDRNKSAFVLGAADPELFKPHQRSGGAVGFCTAFYPRKSPDRILDIIKMVPDRKFILLGRNWDQYERFQELIALPNLSYVEAPYSDYPQYYAAMDVFVSPSKLEGGPIPLIESMMCNVVPVASRTGFAPDVIQHGENGFLFDVDSPAEEICKLIEQAYQLQADVRKTVEHLSWERFSLEIQSFLR